MYRLAIVFAAVLAVAVRRKQLRRKQKGGTVMRHPTVWNPKLQETTFMKRIILIATLSAFLPLTQGAAQDHAHAPNGSGDSTRVPLYGDLGNHHYEITTRVPKAQEYFDQGLRLYYGFNHAEAIRSFKEAQRLDPECAMCWWGEAMAWGPNINLPMDSAGGAAANAAIPHAVSLKQGTTPKEKALIEALAERYGPDPMANRGAQDSAYANAMAEVVRQYPDDLEVAVLYGESIMNLRPWNYWTDEGHPQPGIPDLLTHLERVLDQNENHPGACHFFIHTVEKVHPERAIPCAERLAGLMPGAGHIVHMPGHIYIRVGRYADAIRANEHAVHADETYIQDQRPGVGVYTAGYYPHNYDFLAFAASMIGRADRAIMAADKVAEVIPENLLGAPGFTFLQHYGTRYLQLRVRFGRWTELLSTPAPAAELLHARAMWDYAQGRALAATGNVEKAQSHLVSLRAAADHPELADATVEPNNSGDILSIASKVLEGWIAAEQDDYGAAVSALTEAARLEDGLLYGEPPEWTIPVRQDLGAVLLQAGRYAEAERVFRKDLSRFPDNGWSLFGLADALRAQGQEEETAEVEARFREVWKGSDLRPST
jgi:tetratricopeptide (TPR) repeat protein